MGQYITIEYVSYILIVVGLIVLGISMFYESSKSKLKRTGILVDGIIFEQTRESTFENSNVKDKISIRFLTQEKEWITALIQQDFQLFYTGQYKDRETVKVYYDRENPYNFYVDTKQFELLARVLVGTIGLCILLVGLYKLYY